MMLRISILLVLMSTRLADTCDIQHDNEVRDTCNRTQLASKMEKAPGQTCSTPEASCLEQEVLMAEECVDFYMLGGFCYIACLLYRRRE